MEKNNLEILVVDDNLSFIQSFEMLLRSVLGSNLKKLDIAYNGREAIEKNSTQQGYDYIFMDVNMPELNGIVASKSINKEYYRKTKIIAISFNSDIQTMKNMVFSGAIHYINKAQITYDVIAKLFKEDNPIINQ